MQAFIDKPSEIEGTMKMCDVEIVFTPKAYCELAGRGINYLWGISKMLFCQENASLQNDDRMNNLKERVHKLSCSASIKTTQKCCRTARDYELSYLELVKGDDCDLNLRA